MSRSTASPNRLSSVRLIRCGFLAAAFTGSLLVSMSRAQLTTPRANDKYITKSVSQIMTQQHLTRHPLDQEIDTRWMTQFLKMLDTRKQFFMQSDVDYFMQFVNRMDQMAKAGDTSLAYDVFKRFLQRLDERVKLADELLAMNHDFTLDEELITDPDQIAWAKTDAEMRDRWRLRIKYDLLDLATLKPKADTAAAGPNGPRSSAKSEGRLEGKAAQDKISKRYHQLARRMKQTDDDELLEMFLTALTTSYDPHTTYMSPTTREDFDIQMRLNLEGIGAALQDVDGETIIKKVIPGGAAAKDGRLKPEDRIVGVGQAEGPIVDVSNMKLRNVVKLIRGHQGTPVRLSVIPEGETDPRMYNLVRQQIELSDQEARSVILEAGAKPDGTPYKVGVINLPSFYMDMEGARAGRENFKSTTRDVSRLLKDFNQQKVDAVVVDLRHNGGGSLTESIKLTGLFIDRGPVVQVKDADGQKTQFDDTDPGVEWSGPLVVLINKYSASASEIFAGALQDYKRALIVGDTSTHGKGTVQSLMDIGQKLFTNNRATQYGALKITEQQFYRPDGDSTQNRGVLADIELPSITSQLERGEASLDYAMKFDRVDPLAHQNFNLTDKAMITELKSKSEGRLKDNKEFQRLLHDIDHFKAQNEKKRISLNRQKFEAERAELTADKQEEQEFEELNDPNRPVVKRDFYFNEVLSITTDYAKMLGPQRSSSVGKR